MSYLFCAFVYDRKAFNPRAIVDPADFGATDESDADFREDEYQAEVKRKERPFSPQALLQDELRLKTDRLLDAIESLDKGEKIWPEPKKAVAKKKAPAAKKKSPKVTATPKRSTPKRSTRA